tara:strand:- start:453 stop:629 length:177 start_codon:yes stop_codon:yes gene_type:complete
MKTYKLIIKIDDKNEVQSIKETMVSDERCLEVGDIELTDFMDEESIGLLQDANEIGIA